ncbi:MAG: membrane integrity-associated transporter subunit PqiC [Deltaproteobacteria bacterium]|nr:membrane integrity-associated transporter subunit PqiC [Deltaproteobacteria bacterium]
MKKYCAAPIAVILGVTFLISGSCALRSSTTTKFYILSPLASPVVEKQNEKGEKCKTIGVGPLHLPAYLDRPQIVTRVNPNELKLAELDNWAEPLKDNVTRVLVENISQLLCTRAVVIFPWKKSSHIDYQIDIKIVWMDGKLGEKAILITQWVIIDGSGKSVLLTKKSQYTETVTESTYSAFVAAHSRLIAAFSHDIAQAIKSLS